MPAQSEHQYADTCASIARVIEDCNYKIKVTAVNKAQIDQYNQKIQQLQDTLNGMDNIKSYLSPMVKDIKEYLAARRRQSMQSINNAIRITSEIIPDAMPNITFELKGDEAYLQTSDGLLVNLSEGAGYKSVLSAFLRSVTLNSNLNNLQFIIFDEIFSKLSVEYSTVLSAFLGVMVQNMQLISIEQKPEVYANVSYVEYKFTKNGNYTSVEKNVVNNNVQNLSIS